MKIVWHGHACFEIIAKEGNIVIDPYVDDSVPGLHMDDIEANVLLTSHKHSDHCGIEKIKVIGNDNIKVEKIDTYHDDKQGTLRGNNIIHIVEVEGMRVAHLGDLGCDIDNDMLFDLDVMMIPVGGHYTIDSKTAKYIVDKYQPRIVVPMHYRGDTFGYGVISTVDEFVSLSSDVIEYDDNSILVDKNTKKQTVLLKIA